MMDIFGAYGLVQFGFIVIVFVIVIWRMVMQLKDIMLIGAGKTMDWIGRRRSGL